MKIKCENCGIEETGRYKKLVEKGWKVFFLFEKQKVVRCKKCKPNQLDKVRMKFVNGYKHEMYNAIKEQITKLKILKGLKTKEELRSESFERRWKQKKYYNYQRNIHKKKGSKSRGS